MKKAQMDKCLCKLQRLIPKPEARMETNKTVHSEEEIVDFTLVFVIQGAWLNRSKDTINVHIVVEDWSPKVIDANMRLVQRMAAKAIERELEWMKDVPWRITVDHGSLEAFQGLSRKNLLRMDLTRPIRRHEMQESEVVEVVSEFLAELRPELADVLLAKHEPEGDGLIRLEGAGLPCPLCLGHLSEETIFGLYHRLRMGRFFHGMCDD